MIIAANNCTFVIENQSAILTNVTNNIGPDFIIPPFVNKIPVEVIGDKVFQNNTKLVNVGIPASVTEIKEGAFANCANLKNIKLTPKKETNEYLESIGLPDLKDGSNLFNLIKRPEVKLEKLTKFLPKEYSNEILEQVEINIKYEGYIKKELEQIEKQKKTETIILPDIDYNEISGLRLEARQKLNKFKPSSIGSAKRIDGVSPSDINVLLVYLKVKGII